MNRPANNPARARVASIAACLALSLGLAACFDGDDDAAAPDPGMMTPEPTPTPTQTAASLDVTKCLGQTIPGTGGVTVAAAAVPDVLRINTSAAAGFPNGRKPADPVIDVILAVLLLDVNAEGQSPATFASLPLNPPANDVAFRASFPFLAPPQGTPPVGGAGSGFSFRSDPASAYTRVDRMAFPALSTALIPSDTKIAYNDANPIVDANGEFVDEIVARLTGITGALDEDLTGLGLNICAD